MLKVSIAILCLLFPAAVEAFPSCATTQLAGPGASVAEEGSNPVAWNHYLYAGYVLNDQVVVVASSDNGVTLGRPVTVYSGGRVNDVRMAVSHGHVYALWLYNRGSTHEVMFAASQDHAKAGTWGAPKVLGPHYEDSLTQIAADGDNVHVAFQSDNSAVMVASSSDAGLTFSKPVQIAALGSEIVIASQGPHVYLAWDGDVRIHVGAWFAVSHDGGATFATKYLNDSPPGEPILALDQISGRLSAVWREGRFPTHGVYRQSLDHGDTWSAPIVIPDLPTRQYMVADDGTDVYVSYLKRFDVPGGYDFHVYVAISRNGGHSFLAGKDLSGPTGIAAVHGDSERPIPWAWDGHGDFRLTGVEADGVHVWNGSNGHVVGSSYLGPGFLGSPVRNSMLWEGPNSTVMYAVCKPA